MSADLGGDPDIVGNLVYHGRSLSLVYQFWIGGAVDSESNPPSSFDIDVGNTDICTDDLFFSNKFCDNLYYDVFYDAVKTLHKNGTLATYAAVPTHGDEYEVVRK